MDYLLTSALSNGGLYRGAPAMLSRIFLFKVNISVNLDINMKEIVFYRMESGRCPVEEFLDSLTDKQAQKVVWVMQLVEEMEIVPAQYFKKLTGTDELWEMRVQFATDIFRLLGFFDGSNVIVLNHAFQKKSKKAPRQEISISETRKREYLNRRFKN